MSTKRLLTFNNWRKKKEKKKKTTTYDVAQNGGGVKPVNGIQTFSL
jgi:hypothetical protein